MPAEYRLLGVDPGSRVTGYGIIDVDGDRTVHVASGCLRLPEGELSGRLQAIFTGLSEVIATHRPTRLAIERVFVARNAHSALVLGHARGAAICAAVQAGLPVHEHAAREIKQAIVGRGNADKVQVQHMVRMLLSLPEAPAADAADALACALCHAHTSAVNQRIAAAAGAGL